MQQYVFKLIPLISFLCFISLSNSNDLPKGSVTYSVNSTTITQYEVNIAARTHYDLQSNGVIHYLIQDPGEPYILHSIFLCAGDPAPWNTRNVRYFLSTDMGETWNFIDDVAGSRSGFPSLGQTIESKAVVMTQNADGGGLSRAQLYVDSIPLTGSWRRLDPGSALTNPVVAVSSNDKALWVASGEWDVCTDLNSPGTFSGYQNISNLGVSEYAVACGTGVWGIAYIGNDRGAYLIQSTNEGVSFGTPTTIWNWHSQDSIGVLRSIDLIYEGSNPRVLAGLAKVTSDGSVIFLNGPGKEIFWAPDVNGGTPTLIDSANMMGTNPVNDAFVGCCRGVLGMELDGSLLYAAYNVTTGQYDSNGNDYFDVWYRYSFDHGATWGPKTRLTNLSGPVYDYRYVSISPTNMGPKEFSNYNAHIVTEKDSIPGSSVNGSNDSQAKMWFIDITSPRSEGIRSINGEVPATYVLKQNFPNPFNPSTKINFDIPKSGFVTLKVYDVTGRMVANLVSQNIAAGKFEYEWNANNMPSGVYFYTLKAGDPSTGSGQSFTQTKKMVLLK